MNQANPLRDLHALGQSVWLDFIRRSWLNGIEVSRLVEDDGLAGMTSNPAIFEQAIVKSHDYDEAIVRLARAGLDATAIYETLAVEDIRHAAELFDHVYRATHARDGYVSLEVSPHLAHDTAGTLAEARHLWQRVGMPNVMIKVPATVAGLPAISALIAEGINVNVTLIFGLARYRAVAEAYISGLEQRLGQGGALAHVASVASFFVSRVDTLLDPKLPEHLQGHVAVANSQAAYGIWQRLFAGARWQKLAAAGAQTQRLLWASTSTKNPAYSDTLYVEPLVGADTVNTMPLETLNAYRDHGCPKLRLPAAVADGEAVLARVRDAGIDMEAVADQLEREGVAKFVQPFDRLLETIEARRKAAI